MGTECNVCGKEYPKNLLQPLIGTEDGRIIISGCPPCAEKIIEIMEREE